MTGYDLFSYWQNNEKTQLDFGFAVIQMSLVFVADLWLTTHDNTASGGTFRKSEQRWF